MKPSKKCEICQKIISKYKCPKCLVHYCSSGCFKEHKKNYFCIRVECNKDSSNNTTKSEQVKEEFEYETEDTVPQNQLKQLDNSQDIKNLLHNLHLRQLLKNISNSNNIAQDMNKAMQEPIFMELANKCLEIVGK